MSHHLCDPSAAIAPPPLRQRPEGAGRLDCCAFIRQTALFGYDDAPGFYAQLVRFSLLKKHFRLYLLELPPRCLPEDYRQLQVNARLCRQLRDALGDGFYLADDCQGRFLLLTHWPRGTAEPRRAAAAALAAARGLLPFAAARGPEFDSFSEITSALAETERALRDGGQGPALPEEQESLARQVMEYLRKNYARRVTLGEVAVLVHMNPSYLSRLLPRITGRTFSELLSELRLDRARELLRETGAKNREIAEAAGLENAKYFSEVFKRKTGLTPGEYRRLYRAAPPAPGQSVKRAAASPALGA